MTEPKQNVPVAPPPDGGDRRRLDRAPGERYGAGPGSAAGPGSGPAGPGSAPAGHRSGAGPAAMLGPRGSRALVTALLVADAGALLFFVLGLVDLGIGLVAVAAFTGWVTALALVWWGRRAIPVATTRMVIGALLGGWSVVGGIIVDWVYALFQGGVLGPLDYVAQRYGLVALLCVVVGAGVATLRAR